MSRWDGYTKCATFCWYQKDRYTIPLYRRSVPALEPLSDEVIEEIHKEFPSRIDLFVRAIEKMHGIGETE